MPDPTHRAFRLRAAAAVGLTLLLPIGHQAFEMARPYFLGQPTPFTRLLGPVAAPFAHGGVIVLALAAGFALFVLALRAATVPGGSPARMPAVGLAYVAAGACALGTVGLVSGAGALAAGWSYAVLVPVWLAFHLAPGVEGG